MPSASRVFGTASPLCFFLFKDGEGNVRIKYASTCVGHKFAKLSPTSFQPAGDGYCMFANGMSLPSSVSGLRYVPKKVMDVHGLGKTLQVLRGK